uniref:Cytochrome c oxidase subunit 3 n=1 Tax=Sacculina sp. 'Beibu Gulf' TaxID=2861897 RepID=A0A8F9R8Z5_9CRUS|nr:cytochrome c oxidase subunit 3 [Sacculina sp. 'Beibu Gulf']
MMMDKVFSLYHTVNLSPWPFVISLNTFSFFICLIMMLNYKSVTILLISTLMLLFNTYLWWRDVNRESSFMGCHTSVVMNMVLMGMVLFIVSEIFFFFSFFWETLHSMLSLGVEFSFYWPPKGIKFFSASSVPLLNTIILLSSGITATYSHFLLLNKIFNKSLMYLVYSIVLGCYFTFLQGFEYYEASFTMADSVFGSIFFILTGFHGLHVILGTLFLFVSLFRFISFFTTSNHNLNFEMALWYWHFVDVVWLFLFLILYIWSN